MIEGHGKMMQLAENSRMEREILIIEDCNFAGEDLSGLILEKIKFIKVDFNRLRIIRGVWRNVELINCDLSSIESIALQLKSVTADSCNLIGSNFSSSHFNEVALSRCKLNNSNLSECIIEDSHFRDCQIQYAVLNNSKFRSTSIEKSDFTKSSFRFLRMEECNIHDSIYTGSNMGNSQYLSCSIEKSSFNSSNISNSKFFKSTLMKCSLSLSNLSTTQLIESNLLHCKLNEVNLENAHIRSCELTYSKFKKATVSNMVIDRLSFDDLGSDKGELTLKQLRQLKIKDDLIELRRFYGGFWFNLHLLSVVIFLVPYILFLLKLRIIQLTVPDIIVNTQNTVSVLSALLRYIYSGGEVWSKSSPLTFSFVLVCSTIGYNMVRIILLWKVLKLNHEEKVSGMRPYFRLKGIWLVLHYLVSYGYWVNLVVLLIHTYHFMQSKVPLL